MEANTENTKLHMPTREQQREYLRLAGMVDDFAEHMKQRLYQKLLEGYTGWDANLPENILGLLDRASIALDGVQNGLAYNDNDATARKLVDVANRLAMVWRLHQPAPDTVGVRCMRCGSTPDDPETGTSWRTADGRWQHICPDTHPQAGHSYVQQ